MRVGQPVVHGCPANLGGEAGQEQEVGGERSVLAAVVARQLSPGEAVEPAGGDSGREQHNPEQGNAEPE